LRRQGQFKIVPYGLFVVEKGLVLISALNHPTKIVPVAKNLLGYFCGGRVDPVW